MRLEAVGHALEGERGVAHGQEHVGAELVEVVALEVAVHVRAHHHRGALVPEALEEGERLLVDALAARARGLLVVRHLLLQHLVHRGHDLGEAHEGLELQGVLLLDQPVLSALHVDDGVVRQARVRHDQGLTVQPGDVGVERVDRVHEAMELAVLAADLVAHDDRAVDVDQDSGDQVRHDVLGRERQRQAADAADRQQRLELHVGQLRARERHHDPGQDAQSLVDTLHDRGLIGPRVAQVPAGLLALQLLHAPQEAREEAPLPVRDLGDRRLLEGGDEAVQLEHAPPQEQAGGELVEPVLDLAGLEQAVAVGVDEAQHLRQLGRQLERHLLGHRVDQ
mmetsp:Transcript_46190/g.119457  ORF Transcript_46190/g.119457 Transcript_46190/m.119457 type:complete len:337 (-) Transcript_46190:120-1130(-)